MAAEHAVHACHCHAHQSAKCSGVLATPSMCMQLERAAVEKWGSMPEVEAERNAREQKRLKRALEHAGNAPSQKPYMHMPILRLNNTRTHASSENIA